MRRIDFRISRIKINDFEIGAHFGRNWMSWYLAVDLFKVCAFVLVKR